MNGSAGSCGMIYLSWSSRSKTPGEGNGETLQQLWKSFASRETETWFQSNLFQAEKQWISNDLFITVSLPEGELARLEDWLLELAYQETKSWENQLLRLQEGLLQNDRAVGRLHVGVSVVVREEFRDGENMWYEASKRAILHGQSADAMERSLRQKSFERLLAMKGSIYPVYQPIISLSEGHVFGYEALTRFHDRSWFEGPQQLFQFAESAGQLYALDRLARENAIDHCSGLERDQKLFINVMAQIMEDPGFSPGQTISLLEEHRLKPHTIVFEITERSSIADYPAVKKVLEHYRSQGYQIAIDDVGAGYSSLQSIVELRPDFIKVDRSIIQNIHEDDMKRHVLHTLMEIGAKMNVSLIAEGIETNEELTLLKKMGVDYAQGYLLGKPAAFRQD